MDDLPAERREAETGLCIEELAEARFPGTTGPGAAGLDPFFRMRVVTAAEGGDATVTAPLFLSLILLVLAFFIVLVSISQLDAERSARVIDSVAEVFAHDPQGPPDSDRAPSSEGAQRGDVVDGEDFEQSLKRLFATELALAEFASVVPGRVLEVTLKGDDLFYRQQARLRAAGSRMLDRLVTTVTLQPVSQRVEVAGLIGAQTSLEGDLPVTPSALAVRRAGALGAALVRSGLPRSQLSIGIRPDEEDSIVLVFSLVTAEGGLGMFPPLAGTGLGPR